MAGSEPSDAIRVVNALLTQIDQVKRYHNVLILTTSNVTGAIDLAFVDRYTDIVWFIIIVVVVCVSALRAHAHTAVWHGMCCIHVYRFEMKLFTHIVRMDAF